ncbi:MAG: LrgB family protein [Gorillibacterium sp.]|nr:LrgB family protein [Gorillibacterium sp.]
MLPLLYFLITVVAYVLATKLYRKTHFLLFSPFLIAPLTLAVLLIFVGIQYESYNAGASYLTKLLQPATIALVVPLYRYSGLLRKHLVAVSVGMMSGIMLSFGSTLTLAYLAGMDSATIKNLLPHSVTTPFAMLLADAIKGDAQITVLFTIMTGICGMIIGPLVIRLFNIQHEVSKGVLLGVGAHAAGTAKAFELGEQEGAIASVVTIITALIMIILVPVLFRLFDMV